MDTSSRTWSSWSLAVAALAALSCGGGGGGGGPTCDLAAGGTPGAYQIELRYLSTLTTAQQDAFEAAKARLEAIVTTDPSAVTLTWTSDSMTACQVTSGQVPATETIAGLAILVTVDDLGSTGIIARSGPCLIRSKSHLPLVAVMNLNSHYLDGLTPTELGDTVLHEMIHTLGFGTMWAATSKDGFGYGLLANAGKAGASYTGFQALCGAKADNQAPQAWTSVPVEDCVDSPSPCGDGTRDSHWKYSTFTPELMTGWVKDVSQPLSALTIASLHDLGYEVDLSKADAWTIPSTSAARSLREGEAGLWLGDDVRRVPPLEVEEVAVP